MSLSIIQTLCLVNFAKQAYMAAGVSVSVSLTVSKNDMKIHEWIFVKFSRNVDNSARNSFQFGFIFEKIAGCNCRLNSCLRAAIFVSDVSISKSKSS